MSSAEMNRLKLDLINWIQGLKEPGLLQALHNLKSGRSQPDWWDELTEHDKKEILLGLDDLKEGRVMTSDQIFALFSDEEKGGRP
jgi:hypothetical protein